MRLSLLDRLQSRSNGKLVIVTVITPTKAGEIDIDATGNTVGLF